MKFDVRPIGPDEAEQALRIRAQAFNLPRDRLESGRSRERPDRLLGAFEAGRLVGRATVHDLGQFFGGRSVPMGGLASVAVAPHRRGMGVGRALIAAALELMRDRGQVISSLYPATGVPYRHMGWELAGLRVRRRVPLRSLATLPAPTAVEVRPAEPADREQIIPAYMRVAATRNGFVDRSDWTWDLRLDGAFGGEDHRYLYVAERDGEVAGYLAYHHSESTGDDEWIGLSVDEIIAEDPEALFALWRLIATNSSVTVRATYYGGAEEPLAFFLPEQDMHTISDWRWMARLVDAAGAIASRGYPSEVSVSVHLAIDDRHAPWNAGRHVLRVADGKGALEPGGKGEVELSSNALAPLFTGLASARTLAAHGLIHGASPADLDALTVAFAGPVPWMVDFF